MKTIFKTMTLLCLSLILVNCSSDDGDGGAVENTTVTLTTDTWELSTFEIDGEDQTSTLDACQRQETFTFNANGTFTNNVYTTNNSGACDLTTHTGTFTDVSDDTGLRYTLVFENDSREVINMRLAGFVNSLTYGFDVTDSNTSEVLGHQYNFTK